MVKLASGTLQRQNRKGIDADRRRLQFHRLALARHLVRGLAVTFLAENCGGICCISPWNRAAAARTRSRVTFPTTSGKPSGPAGSPSAS